MRCGECGTAGSHALNVNVALELSWSLWIVLTVARRCHQLFVSRSNSRLRYNFGSGQLWVWWVLFFILFSFILNEFNLHTKSQYSYKQVISITSEANTPITQITRTQSLKQFMSKKLNYNKKTASFKERHNTHITNSLYNPE